MKQTTTLTLALVGLTLLLAPGAAKAQVCGADQFVVADQIVAFAEFERCGGDPDSRPDPLFMKRNRLDCAVQLSLSQQLDAPHPNPRHDRRGAATEVRKGKFADALGHLEDFRTDLLSARVGPGQARADAVLVLEGMANFFIGCVEDLLNGG